MAVTGVFQADFSSFFDAVKQSEVHLKELTGDAAKAESGLSKMADSFSGRKIIQDATQMAEVFDRAGSASAFTEKELARMGATGQEAIAKLKALGSDVPPGIQRIADAATTAAAEQKKMLDAIGASGGRLSEFGATAGATTSKMSGLSDSYRQFDGVLQAAGVNIGPQIKGLEDIASVAGKSATSIGALGTAGLAAGAFMTGWKIGEFIDQLTGASSAVEKLTNKIMGYKDALASETAGAKQDVINRALAQGAEQGIKYADAVQYLTDQVVRNRDAKIDWTQRLSDAYREVRNLSDAQKNSIAIATEAGATTEQLTNKYGLSATALGILAEQTDKATAAKAKHNAEQAKDLADADRREQANQKGIQQMETDYRLAQDRAAFDAEQLTVSKLAAGKAYVDQMGQVAKVNKDAADFDSRMAREQAELEKKTAMVTAAYKDLGDAHTDAGQAAQDAGAVTVAAYQGVSQQVELTSDGIRGWIALMQYTAKANAILSQNSLFTSSAQYEAIGNIHVPSFASGVENFGGGLAKVHGGEVLMNLPQGTSVIPKGQGLGSNISNVFNLVDSESNLARRVSEMIMKQIRAGTQLSTA